MTNRLSTIVTKTGDTGTTGLADGQRLPKSHPRICAIGEVDELNSHIGLLISQLQHMNSNEIEQHCQHQFKTDPLLGLFNSLHLTQLDVLT